MNGEEQRARHTAVARVEKRLDDLELVVMTLAEDLVGHGHHVTEQLRVLLDQNRLAYLMEAERVDLADRDLDLRIAAHRGMTLWRRLQWFVVGCARG